MTKENTPIMVAAAVVAAAATLAVVIPVQTMSK
jgi:hypothetical protein